MISVVIPAHNEEAVIGRCLASLTAGESASSLQIIVVCNGCNDNTAAVAGQFPGVKVIAIDKASKIAALNAGDQALDSYPVAYVDADVDVSAEDLVIASEGLSDSVHIVAPRLRINLVGSNIWVRAFYRIWMQLPYFATNNMVGSGIFILSEAGRKRFGVFPDVIADDGYVRGLFNNSERRTIDGCQFTVFAPTTLPDLIKIKTRVRFGNMQVAAQFPGMQVGGENSSAAFLRLLLTKPWLIPSGGLYFGVQWLTKRRAKARFKSQQPMVWDRDNSSRVSR